jgi:hypothetical protein
MAQPLHKSQHTKNLGNTRIAYKPRTMDKVQKHNSFNTNTPSSESYKKDFFPLCHCVQIGSGVHQAFYPIDTGILSLGVNRPVREADLYIVSMCLHGVVLS